MHKGQKSIYLVFYLYWALFGKIALYSYFEACSIKKRILQRSGEGNQLTENNDNQGEAEEAE